LDSAEATSRATFSSVGVRLLQPLSARRCRARGPRRMPYPRNRAEIRPRSQPASSSV
jgi:hypothetical protein